MADMCKSCEYENAAFMPCNACNNGSEFKLKKSELDKFKFKDYYSYFLLGLIKCYDDSVDPDDIAKQADAYVRDHLLIQYMMWKFGKACMLDIEDIYDEWIKWLEEKE